VELHSERALDNLQVLVVLAEEIAKVVRVGKIDPRFLAIAGRLGLPAGLFLHSLSSMIWL